MTRISRGRSLREIILGMISFGTLEGGVLFRVLGNYALHLDIAGILDVTGIMAARSEAQALASVIASLPSRELALAAFVPVAVVLLAVSLMRMLRQDAATQ